MSGLKRYSSVFSRKKDSNGTATNKSSNNSSVKDTDVKSIQTEKTANRNKSISFKKEKKLVLEEDHQASRKDVEDLFSQYSQLLHASNRPVPTQTGDGIDLEHNEATGIWDDLKHVGFKNVETLRDVIKDKISAHGQTDDKTYLMERVIQVC
jgi:linoleate 10R-lipoxygenase